MAAKVGSWVKPALLRALLSQARLALRLLRDPGVPMVAKFVPLLVLFYLMWPVDIVPDVLPIVGQLDDIGVLVAGLELFVRACPAASVAFHRDAMASGRKYSPMRPEDRPIQADFRREA